MDSTLTEEVSVHHEPHVGARDDSGRDPGERRIPVPEDARQNGDTEATSRGGEEGQRLPRAERDLAGPAPLREPAVAGHVGHIDVALERSTLMVRFHCDVEHRGTFLGVAPTGRKARLDGHTSMHFRDGRVVERWSSADFLGLLLQLGATALPTAP